MPTVHYIIEGKVQNVGFRRYVLHKANTLELHGFVCNLDDGTLECLAQGSSDSLQEFEMILRQGPRFAEVTSVNCTDVDGAKKYTQFRIL
jgi:acylphosphatase